ncbi:hypothetical protein SapgrDRAFT_3190 [Saprospira grandis DSM 2844]|uniref:Uncharacterized protein n=1 Tax=Saprospira grandis DSM 2844 TaxID=694433 RepID=J1I7P3_9BACT|nr:hypothetical protein SapgrDRAFT_3190 [Saprospira grandis DSM 2844]
MPYKHNLTKLNFKQRVGLKKINAQKEAKLNKKLSFSKNEYLKEGTKIPNFASSRTYFLI